MGPNYSISTACATSNFCILNAANHIMRGEAVSDGFLSFHYLITGQQSLILYLTFCTTTIKLIFQILGRICDLFFSISDFTFL